MFENKFKALSKLYIQAYNINILLYKLHNLLIGFSQKMHNNIVKMKRRIFTNTFFFT